MAETPTIELKRHYVSLSQKETEELVGIMADFVVDHIKRCDGPGRNREEKHGEEHGPSKNN
ncbi:MAG: hypothetical protein V1809_01810 [Planctomycetota bacterium]